MLGTSWDGRLLRTQLMKIQRMGGLTEYGWEQGWGPWETIRLWQLQNIVSNGLLMRINGGGSSSPTRSRYATTEEAIEYFTIRYCRYNKGLFLCAECYETHIIDADIQELNHQLLSWSFHRFYDFMYDVITIPITFQLTQNLDPICVQRPNYAIRPLWNCLRQILVL